MTLFLETQNSPLLLHLCSRKKINENWLCSSARLTTESILTVDVVLGQQKKGSPTDYTPAVESTHVGCLEPLRSVPTCITTNKLPSPQQGSPPRCTTSARRYPTTARSRWESRRGQLGVPTVTPLGAGNTSWEFLAVWHSVTWRWNILSPLQGNLFWVKSWAGMVPVNESLSLLSTTSSYIELQLHKERKPGLSVAQCPECQKLCWTEATVTKDIPLLHYATPPTKNSSYVIDYWDMTCSKVPQVTKVARMGRNVGWRQTRVAKVMTALKAHSHSSGS